MKVLLTILILAVLALLFWVFKVKGDWTAETIDNMKRIGELEDEAIKQQALVTQFQEKVKEYEERIFVVSDEAPEKDTANAKVLKLSNEIAPYVKVEDGKVKLTLFIDKVEEEPVEERRRFEPVEDAVEPINRHPELQTMPEAEKPVKAAATKKSSKRPKTKKDE